MRVHELAKELGVKGSDLLLLLEELGIGGKTSSSAVPAEVEALVRSRLGRASALPAAPAAPQVKTVRVPGVAPAASAADGIGSGVCAGRPGPGRG